MNDGRRSGPNSCRLLVRKWCCSNVVGYLVLVLVSLGFFWKTWVYGFLPIPADALVGMYHPFRDYFSDFYPNGVAYKNYLLTDPVLQQYPWKWLAINNWQGFFQKGLSFFENPYNFSGTSLVANIQAGFFYPLNFIFFFGQFELAWTLFIILQPILSAVLMGWWLKDKNLKPLAWISGGLIWAFSSFNSVWLEWGNVGHAGLWLPLVLLSIDKMAKNRKQKTKNKELFWHLGLQLALISSFLAGHLQVTLYLLLAAGLYLWPGVVEDRDEERDKGDRGNPGRMFSLLASHLVVFLVVTSIQWVPALRFLWQSNRAVEQENVLTREGFFIEPRQLGQLVAPDFFGNSATQNYRGVWNYAEQVVYVGLVPLLLATAVLAKGYPGRSGDNQVKKLKRLAIFLVVGGLLLAVKNPLAELPYRLRIPFWSSLQPTRLSYLVTFGLAVLAAVGIEGLMRSPKLAARKLLVGAVGITGVIGGMWLAAGRLDSVDQLVARRNLVLPVGILGWFLIVLAVTFFLKKTAFGRRGSLFIVGGLLFLVVVDLFRFGWKFTPFSPREYLYPLTPAIEYLQEQMRPEDRYMTLDRRILPPNANIIYQLRSIEGYDPIYSRDYALLITQMETDREVQEPASFSRIVRPANWRSPIAHELGVKYVLSLAEIEDASLKKVFQEGETRIYELVEGK